MRKLKLLFVSALMAVPMVGALGSPAHACTSPFEPDGCAVINRVCQKLFGASCLG
jgi:hypothetical protein